MVRCQTSVQGFPLVEQDANLAPSLSERTTSKGSIWVTLADYSFCPDFGNPIRKLP